MWYDEPFILLIIFWKAFVMDNASVMGGWLSSDGWVSCCDKSWPSENDLQSYSPNSKISSVFVLSFLCVASVKTLSDQCFIQCFFFFSHTSRMCLQLTFRSLGFDRLIQLEQFGYNNNKKTHYLMPDAGADLCIYSLEMKWTTDSGFDWGWQTPLAWAPSSLLNANKIQLTFFNAWFFPATIFLF